MLLLFIKEFVAPFLIQFVKLPCIYEEFVVPHGDLPGFVFQCMYCVLVDNSLSHWSRPLIQFFKYAEFILIEIEVGLVLLNFWQQSHWKCIHKLLD